jgi:hypothetical protein
MPLRNHYRVTKYDPVLRDASGAYTGDDWIMFEQIGQTLQTQTRPSAMMLFIKNLRAVIMTLAFALVVLASACGGHTTTVTVTVTPPAKPLAVPFVVGLPEALAVQKLKATGLTAKVSRHPSTSHRRGIVYGQSPAAAEKVGHGATVMLVVSTGKR